MKRFNKVILLISLLAIGLAGFAQAPNLLNYQAVARNTAGNPLPNQKMNLRLSIHNFSSTGSVVYTETRAITTNAGGLFAVQIGSAGATAFTGTLSGVNWLDGDKYLQVELDPDANNNYSNLGNVQLISVPYSLSSVSATTAVTANKLSGLNTSVATLNNVSGTNTGDNAVNSLYAGLVSNATHTGDAEGSTALTVKGINGTPLSGLGTGILKNTTGTGVPSIAIAGTDYLSPTGSAAGLSNFPTLNQNTTGNAATATKLATPKNINGIPFDGSADITISASVDVNQLTGTTLNSTITGSSLTTVGTLNNLTVTNPIAGSVNGNAATATKLAAPKNINGIPFDGTADITISASADAGTLTGTTLKSTVTNSSLTSVGTLTNLTVTNPIAGSVNGNAATATKLAAPKNINGVPFDGSNDITISATSDAGTLTGTTLNSTVTSSSLTSVGTLANLTVTNPIAGSVTGNAANVTGTVAVANGGTGATTLTGIVKGNGTSAMTAAVAGTDYQAPISLTTTGSGAATLSGNTLNIPSTTNYTLPTASSSALGGVKVGTNLSIDGSGVLSADISGKLNKTDTSLLNLVSRFETKLNIIDTTAMLSSYLRKRDTTFMLSGYLRKYDNATTATLAGNITATTNTTLTSLASLNTVGTITSGTISLTTNISTTGTLKAGTITYPNTAGTNGYYLKTDGTGTASWAAVSSGGVPYTGATGAVNLGAYDLTVQTVNGLTLGNGSGTHNTIVGGSSPNRTFNSVQSNTAIGYNTISSATPGSNNTAVGAWSLVDNNNGSENSVMGVGAMQRNLGGKENTAIGYFAMQNNLTGSGNTALGYKAGFSSDNTTINNATAIGYQAKVAASNTIQLGADGTAGTTAITNVKTSGTLTAGTVTYPNAHRSTAGDVLTINSSGTASWAASSSSSGVPYTGATQAVNLGGYNLTVNELTIGSGKVGTSGSSSNTIVGGAGAPRTFTTVSSNTAIGFGTMSAAIPGNNNTAVGAYSLVSTTGVENSVIGAAALERNLGGNGNTAIGYYSLRNNLSGSNNTALGRNSLIIDPPGSNNTVIGASADLGATNLTNATAIGYQAKVAASNTIQLGADGTNGTTAITNVKTSGTITAGTVTYPNTHGQANQVLSTTGSGTLAWATPLTGDLKFISSTGTNVGVGYGTTLGNATGTDNVALGRNALGNYYVSNSGSQNVGIGTDAGDYTTSGSRNVYVGVETGVHNQTGNDNTFVGFKASTSTGNRTNINNISNSTAIGANAVVAASNTIQLGNTSVTDVKTSGTITAGAVTYPKTDGANGQVLTTNGAGTLTWAAASSSSASDLRIKKNITNTNYGLSTVMQLRPVEYNLISNDLKQVGFIAQEVKKLVPEVVTGKEGDLKKGEILGITYANLVPVLTKAIQEQQTIIDNQNKRLSELESLVKKLEATK